jgi:hypothetical protein
MWTRTPLPSPRISTRGGLDRVARLLIHGRAGRCRGTTPSAASRRGRHFGARFKIDLEASARRRRAFDGLPDRASHLTTVAARLHGGMRPPARVSGSAPPSFPSPYNHSRLAISPARCSIPEIRKNGLPPPLGPGYNRRLRSAKIHPRPFHSERCGNDASRSVWRRLVSHAVVVNTPGERRGDHKAT